MAEEIVDLAVVGGGVSGIYTAWRLLTTGKVRQAMVIEANDHIGGRLLSVRPPGIPNMVAELGGMRILPAVQPRIVKLLDELQKTGDPIPIYPFPVDEPENLAYLRGTYLRLSDFTTSPSRVPYHLAFQEYGNTAGQTLVNAIEQIVPGITNQGLTEEQRRAMAQQATFDDRPLYRQGFWNVLTRVISKEAYQLGIDAGGYESTLSNWNAADAIPWFLSDFGVAPQYYGFANGFQEVPLTLEKRFRANNGRVLLDTMVCGLDWQGEDFVLQLKQCSRSQGEKRWQPAGTIRARHVILAMPRRSLELLAAGSPLLQGISDLITSVTPRPLFKLFITYTNPWWRAAGLWKAVSATVGEWTGTQTGEWRTTAVQNQTSYVPIQKGRTTTDLPLRQTYYWPKNDGSPVTEGRAMLLASYDDGLNIGYWDGFRDKRGIWWHDELQHIEPLKRFAGSALAQADSHSAWNEHAAPDVMVTEMQRQLALIHGLAFIPEAQDAAYKDWGDEPFGGGWNNWNIGVKSWEVKERIVQPFDGTRPYQGHSLSLPLYICGEAYSDAQGWVEGALQTADLVLAKFGIV